MKNLKHEIEFVGAENCMFLVPMKPVTTLFGLISFTSKSDPDFIVPARICEKRYKIKDNYKITLVSDYPQFGKLHFYLSDLQKMINDGHIEFFMKPTFIKPC